jgi:hypothetical protein
MSHIEPRQNKNAKHEIRNSKQFQMTKLYEIINKPFLDSAF